MTNSNPTGPDHKPQPTAPAPVNGARLLYLMCVEPDPNGEYDSAEDRDVCGFPLDNGPCPTHGTSLD
ncbi:hypothetical protein ACSNOI_46455 [Actinomadura kijaniata]|uniref:hypothetical protein n=1 Tax=Actinomadura kijaniata TaxID=46161 RepID=UPI003F1DDDC4